MGLTDEDRALLQAAQQQARARMSGRTIDETGRDVVRLSNLLTIPDPVATMTRNGGRQDANTTTGPGRPRGCRAATDRHHRQPRFFVLWWD
ncbi:MAG: hypothetical protein ACK6EB_43935 [Planctomyces sp.]